MILIVDADERTLLVLQEVYDDAGRLVERHPKFPVDTGHEVIGAEEHDTDDYTETGQ